MDSVWWFFGQREQPAAVPIDYLLGGNFHRGMGLYLLGKAIIPLIPLPLTFAPIFGFLFAVLCANMEGGYRRRWQWQPQTNRIACQLLPFKACGIVPVPGYDFGPTFPESWYHVLRPYDRLYGVVRLGLACS
jgi:hypothetical protein